MAAGARAPVGAWQEAGERAYQVVEFLNRAGYAEALAKKGFSLDEIVHLVLGTTVGALVANPPAKASALLKRRINLARTLRRLRKRKKKTAG